MSDYQKDFETIVNKYRQSLFKVAITYEADPALQQDLLQDMFLAIWQALPAFKAQSSLHTFIYRVAYNKALSHVAKQSRKHPVEDLTHTTHCENSDTEANVSSMKSKEKLFNNIRLLPIVQRQLVMLSLEGESYQDISEISGLTVTNVGAQLNRAKQKLTQLMENKS